MPTAIVTVLIFNSTSLSHFSWALVWPCFACPGCAGPSPICHAPFAYRWCSPLFTYLPHSSSPWCPCTLAPWRLATAYWWSSPAFLSTCSSLPGSVSPSGSRSPWVSHLVTHRVASGRFPSVCVSTINPSLATMCHMIYALLPIVAILLGGLTQALQKLMMVVRPKAASKVFLILLLILVFLSLLNSRLTHTHLHLPALCTN